LTHQKFQLVRPTPDSSKISTFLAHPGPINNFNFFGPPRTHQKFQLFLPTPDPSKISTFLAYSGAN
jgi:hypothetical protein